MEIALKAVARLFISRRNEITLGANPLPGG
jgi:hypothetical protein